MLEPGLVIVLGCAVAAVLLGWAYFRRYALERPPIGVVTLGDIAFMLGGVVLLPLLYQVAPLWLVAGLLLMAALSVLGTMLQPVLRARWAVWAAVLLLLGGDVAAALLAGTTSLPFLAVNNVVLVLLAVGFANLWAQSGLKARDAAVLGGALAVYDVVATTLLPMTVELITRLAAIPLVPVVAWPLAGDDRWITIGLGDLLLATVFPLVQRKAFCRVAGLAALATGLAVLATVLGLAALGRLPGPFPVMIVLGPLMVVQYGHWRRRAYGERTTAEYLRAEPLARVAPR